MPKHYMFIVNDLDFGEIKFKARTITDLLLKNKIWAYSLETANVSKLELDDKCLLYLAGKGNRYFMADFIIDEKPKHINFNERSKDLKTLLEYFPLTSKITNINLWPFELPIKDLLSELSFIKDKKNYGLYLRQGIKLLSQEDFTTIKNKKHI